MSLLTLSSRRALLERRLTAAARVLNLAAEDAELLNDPLMEADIRLMWAACTAHFATSTRNRRTRNLTRAPKHADAVTFEQLRMEDVQERKRDRCDAAEVTP